MTIDEIKNIIKPYIEEPIVAFTIEKKLFCEYNGRELFNEIIRNKVDKKSGVYIWFDSTKNQVVYIGMAGKIKTDGSAGDHSIQNRLLASRAKDKITKKDVQTNDYVRDFMNTHNIDTLNFYIMYSKKGEPPAYVESLLLYNYFKTNNCLPKLNSSF
jgi:hypothetical protein